MPSAVEERGQRVAAAKERLAEALREEATAAEEARRAAAMHQAALGTPDEEPKRHAAFRARRKALGAKVRVQGLGLELREAELDLRAVQRLRVVRSGDDQV